MSSKGRLSLILAVGAVFATGASAAQVNHSQAQPAHMKRSVAQQVFDTREFDKKVGPCQNLNTFVNAHWIATHPIPPDHSRWGEFDKLDEKTHRQQHKIVKAAAKHADAAKANSIKQKIGYLYRSGMDKAGIAKADYDPIKPRLAKIDALKSRAQIAPYLTQAFAHGNGQVFDLEASPDYKHATRVIAYVYQGGLGLPTPKYYTAKQYAGQRKAYVHYITDTFKLIGEPASQAHAQAKQVLAFETKLAKASLSQVAMRNPANQYHFVTLAQANKATPNFDWKQFFAAQNADIKRGFSLSEPKFFKEFNKLLGQAPLAQWRAYLRFHTVDAAAPYLSKPFRDNRFAFYGTTLNGQPQQKPRWRQVLSAVNGAMGQALGQLYVARYFPPAAKARAEKLVHNISLALKHELENVSWMSEKTKQKALAKWHKFLPKIGYPSKWRSWKGLSIAPHGFYANMQAAAKFNHDYHMSKIGKPRDRHLWQMTPQTVNAYYSPTDNTINFPAAILQPPFFYPHGDDAVNYGGIGAVIGHESSHGYDDEGSQFDGEVNYVNWWTKADREAFNARTHKLVEQFDHYTPIASKPNLHVNGQLTLGENIADLNGLTLAYHALQKVLANHPRQAHMKIDGFTENQRFFLAWARVWRGETRAKALEVQLNADPNAPMKFRAIGAPSNMPAFAKAFDCQPSDPMVRTGKQRVQIW